MTEFGGGFGRKIAVNAVNIKNINSFKGKFSLDQAMKDTDKYKWGQILERGTFICPLSQWQSAFDRSQKK